MGNIKIVAEIGCNHNGDVNLAKKMILAAKDAGVDAVKFQSFIASNLVSTFAPKAEYQKRNTGIDESQLGMISKLELSQEEYLECKKIAVENGIEIFSTAFDMESLEFLIQNGQNIWKIPSGEITNLPYLERIRDLRCENKQVILSTGMSSMDEIRFATRILESDDSADLIILHCNTDYPTNDHDMNLHALLDLKNNFPKWNVGLSDHSEGTVAALVAVGIGISFIEKHFTMDKKLPGPDHKASITPKELAELCDGIRRGTIMLGNYRKRVTNSEIKNKIVARKSIVAKRNIKSGEIFTTENITCKRPGNGISPMFWYDVLGLKAEKDFAFDELITVNNINWQDIK